MAEVEDVVEPDISELARRLAARRAIVSGECVECRTPFMGTRKRKFCSHACAQRSHWRNKQAAQVKRGAAAETESRGANDGNHE